MSGAGGMCLCQPTEAVGALSERISTPSGDDHLQWLAHLAHAPAIVVGRPLSAILLALVLELHLAEGTTQLAIVGVLVR